jgi:hypothetical protein
LLLHAYTWPRLTFVVSCLHMTKINTKKHFLFHAYTHSSQMGFQCFACPHKQKIPEEEDWLNEHTQCFVHIVKINNLCCFVQTFVASCLHTTNIDHCLPKHNQDQWPLLHKTKTRMFKCTRSLFAFWNDEFQNSWSSHL